MKVYTKIEAGKPVFSSCKSIELDGRWISNPTPEMIAAAGWEEYQEPQPVVNEPTAQEIQAAEYHEALASSQDRMLELMEDYFAANGSGEIQQLAAERKQIRYQLDELGKIMQTPEGDGSAFNPFKTWRAGMAVKEGEWWQTESGYIWEAIKDGVPSGELDSEYFDVVGV